MCIYSLGILLENLRPLQATVPPGQGRDTLMVTCHP